MPDSLELPRIEHALETRRLTDLFCDVLNWDANAERAFDLNVASPVETSLKLTPVAQLKGLPVLKVDWPNDRLPGLTQRRAVHKALTPRHIEHLLCYETSDHRALSMVWAHQRQDKKTELRSLPFELGQPARTTLDRIAELKFGLGELRDLMAPHVADRLAKAFDVQAVNKQFYTEYEACFREVVKPEVKKRLGSEADAHKFTQLLFNRLLFCWFLQKKGWLGHDTDYMVKLFNRAYSYTPPRSVYHDYISFLFFEVLCNSEEVRRTRKPSDPHISWEAPFLNGGLFERTDLDKKVEALPQLQRLPNIIFKAIIEDLFAHYNFTIEESTPLDVQVALDPELLGSIFEKLVTGRHESGSYYTPRPIVEYMCRESLVHHLAGACPKVPSRSIEDLVYDHNVVELSPGDAADVVRSLDAIKVCDPACGSGAYLVTMLHEFVGLYRAIFSDKLHDPRKDYDLKLRIIQNNLYGVDIDDFAVNIARLRLWLSLVVDSEETDVKKVQPLPNLDFKIEIGDSLTAPDPDPAGLSLHSEAYAKDASILDRLYQEYFERAIVPLARAKAAIEADIASTQARISRLLGRTAPPGAIDWRVVFAEVFARGGFDVVLANPPYIRQELIDSSLGAGYKRRLIALYPDTYVGTADIYVAFYARAHQLLNRNGIGCFISSNKWLRAAYGEKLRRCLLDGQAFHLVVDYGELPVFEAAATFPGVFLWQKLPRDSLATRWATVKDLEKCYGDGIREHVLSIVKEVPSVQFGKDKARLTGAKDATFRLKLEKAGPRLRDVVKGRLFYGIKTGLNNAFVVDRETRDQLIDRDARSAQVIKPLVVGDDVRRFEVHFRERYLLYLPWHYPLESDTSISGASRRAEDALRQRLPAVYRHLTAHKAALSARNRAETGIRYEWYVLQRFGADYLGAFDEPKIIYPDLGMECRFTYDESHAYVDCTGFILPSADWYLLSVLNSTCTLDYMKTSASILGDADKRGRVRFKTVYMEKLPVPDAKTEQREMLAGLARQAQKLHVRRRKRVEKFLRDIGTSPAESSSKNMLEQPWNTEKCTDDYFRKKAKGYPLKLLSDVRDETIAMTEEILKVESEIDARVKALYGL